MDRRTFQVVREPRGSQLSSLLRFAAQESTYLAFVLRNDLGLESEGQQLIERMRMLLAGEHRVSSWPGTILHGETALFMKFTPASEALELIMPIPGGLYDWKQPRLPEDICFLRADGSVVLATIAHESDAYMELTDLEWRALLQVDPALDACLRLEDREGST